MKFEWDENKNQLNMRKHGIDFSEAAYVFADAFALNMPDNEHSEKEERWVILGKSLNERVLLVVHTYRYDNVVRIISARKATTTETKVYMKRVTK